ncbi:hypothetical protein M434DRAFT_37765 [Hypoxylon sp. CO27-5]|nr:hypothetical protein M434DRAFT_37765 [Hypoxylon sp. CO27-5]
MWATGFLLPKAGLLDSIFEDDADRHRQLCDFVTKSFVNLAIAIDSMLKALENDNSGNSIQNFRRHREKLMAALGKGRLLDFAIERWTVLTEAFEENDGELGSREDALVLPLQEIEVIVDSLFNVSPAIRFIRKSLIVNFEEASEVSTPPITVDIRNTNTPSQPYPVTEKGKQLYNLKVVSNDRTAQKYIIGESLRLAKTLEEALRNDETQTIIGPPNQTTSILPVSPKIQKQRHLLEKFDASLGSSPGQGLIPTSKLETVIQLNADLKHTFDAVMPTGWDAKKSLSQEEDLRATDKILEDMVEKFENANLILAGDEA